MIKILKRIWQWLVMSALEAGATKRAKAFVDRFSAYLTEGGKVLDDGCGTGDLGLEIKRRGNYHVTLADIVPPSGYLGQKWFGVPRAKALAKKFCVPYEVYNGIRFSHQDKTFDLVLLAFVLHHAENPEEVLAEAVRVSKRYLVIFEDIPNSRMQAWLNKAADKAVNLEFFGHPHGNRTRAEWEKIFRSHNLKLVQAESWVDMFFGFLPCFPVSMFILEKVEK